MNTGRRRRMPTAMTATMARNRASGKANETGR